VYVDESGCDKRIGFRRTGWSTLGVTPQQVTQFRRGQRYQILPAYSQDGILLSRVFQGTSDTAIFEDFIEQLLYHCRRYPKPNSVLVMDNASFHRSERIRQIYHTAGVKLRNASGQYHFNSTIFAQYHLGIGIRTMLPPTPPNFGAHIGIKRPYGDFRILDTHSDRALPNWGS
jgi:DDE superfamily endonuclease